jgi:hypothetical protein
MTTPDASPTPEPQCDHNWPGITALSIPFAAVVVIVALICGGYPPHTNWQAIAWLAFGIELVMAVGWTLTAWRLDVWRNRTRRHVATIRSRDAEIEQLRAALNGRDEAPDIEYAPLTSVMRKAYLRTVQELVGGDES